jgi:hydrogenase 3 maturation protease
MRKLEKKLQRQLEGCKRIAVLGIGAEKRADDAAGLMLVRRLQSVISLQPFTSLQFKGFEWGEAPEQVTSGICAFEPNHIVVVGAADIGVPVGECREICDDEMLDISFSTPVLLKLFIDNLSQATGAGVSVIAIQRGNRDSENQMTPAIDYGVTRLMHALQTVMWECDLICQGNELPAAAPVQELLSRSRMRPLSHAPAPNARNYQEGREAVPMPAGAA